MDEWLDKQREGEWGALQEHTEILKSLFRGKISTDTAAKEVVQSVKNSTKPTDADYQFTQLVLDAAAEFQATQKPIIALLRDIHQVDSTPNEVMVSFNMYLREKRDALEGERYFSEPESGHRLETSAGPQAVVTPGDRWVNYNGFWARLSFHAGLTFFKGAVFGFFCLRELLEYNSDTREQKYQVEIKPVPMRPFRGPPISMEKLIEYDVMAAVPWVSPALYDMKNSDFGDGWQRGFAVKTDLWSGEPGLSKGRWQLWKEGLERIAERDDLGESVREAAANAAAAIGAFGEGSNQSSKDG